jgi:hypothetical protein
MPPTHWRFYGTAAIVLTALALILFSFRDTLHVEKLRVAWNNIQYGESIPYPNGLDIDPPPGEAPFGSLIVAAGADTDLGWTEHVKDEYVARRRTSDCINVNASQLELVRV